MKRFLATILILTLISSVVSGFTLTSYAAEDYSVSIGDSNRIAVDGSTNGVSFVAQYDENRRLISIEIVHIDSYMPSVNEDTKYMKAFLWDSMEEMNNLAAPAEKEINLAQQRTIKFSDIRDVKMGAARTNIIFWTDKENNKTKTVSIKNDATYTINGETNAKYNNEWLAECVTTYGTISRTVYDAQIDLYCVEASDVYDYDNIKITVYEDFIVDTYDKTENKIYAHTDSPSMLYAIDTLSADYVTSIKDVYGNSVSASELKKRDVLTVCVTPYDWRTTADIQNIEAVLSRSTINGIISEINAADNEVYIDGMKYNISDMCLYMPQLSDKGTCYLNINGEIVLYNPVTAKDKYAIIVNKEISQGVDVSYRVKMYTSDGELVAKEFASKVKVTPYNGPYTSTSSDVDSEVYNQIPDFPAVCTYDINAAGQISKISFCTSEHMINNDSIRTTALVANSLNKPGAVTGGETPVIATDKNYNLTEYTKIIAMNPSVSPEEAGKEDFSVYTYDEFTLESKSAASVSVYDADLDLNAGLVVIYDETFIKEDVGTDPDVPIQEPESGYGVIIAKAPTSNIEPVYQVKMYTDKGEIYIGSFARKVRMYSYDGANTTEDVYQAEEVYSKIPDAPAVCKYDINESGEIYKIALASENCYTPVVSDALVTNVDGEKGKIDVTAGEPTKISVGSDYYMDENTVIIALEKMSNYGAASLDNFAIYTAENFEADQVFSSVSIYNASEDNCAALVFVVDTDISLAKSDNIVIMVKSINEVNNAVGDATAKISGYNNTGTESLILDPESYYPLVAGETITPYTYNAYGEVKKLVRITENLNGEFCLTSDFVNYYKRLLAGDSDSTFYYGKVNYKQKNTIYFENLLDEQNDSFVTKSESIVVPNSAAVMVYDASKASGNKVSYETAGYMSYAQRVNQDGTYDISNTDIKSYYILVRTERGIVKDVVYYCYTTDVPPQALPIY